MSLVRSTHPYGFRSGEWAEVLSIAPTPVVGRHGPEIRECYLVRFEDGATDFLPVADPDADYEFKEPDEGPDETEGT